MLLPPTPPFDGSQLSPGRWSPGVREGLQALIQAHGIGGPAHDAARPPIAAFDFDDTCIAGDISHAILDDLELDSPGLIEAYRSECEKDLRSAYIRLVGTLVSGRTGPEVRQATQRALERGLADGRLAWVEEIRELVGVLKQNGWQTWIVTASPAPVVAVLSPHYGIPAERVLGMQPLLDEAGCYTASLAEPVTYREGKRQALLAATGRDAILAAGDSASDRELLAHAQGALLIDRGDAALRDEARERGWWIQEAWR